MSIGWETDDSRYIVEALREWNFRNPAHTKPAENFGQVPISGQSWILQRAQELKCSIKS
jgi:hypothetical protein